MEDDPGEGTNDWWGAVLLVSQLPVVEEGRREEETRQPETGEMETGEELQNALDPREETPW